MNKLDEMSLTPTLCWMNEGAGRKQFESLNDGSELCELSLNGQAEPMKMLKMCSKK